jgi:D-sedoheptulose 7-phosphate isomerase
MVNQKDVLVALSTSGASPNILRGMDAAVPLKAYRVGFTGETGGALAGKADLLLNVPSRDAQRIQEEHITIGHIACCLIKQLLTRSSS